jgi:hypothetical protein
LLRACTLLLLLAVFGAVLSTAAPARTSKKKVLPPGGSREIVRGKLGGQVLLAVAYSVNNHVTARKLHAPGRPGYRFVAVKVAVQGLGTRPYKSYPATTAVVADKTGRHRFKAYTKRQFKPVLGHVVLRQRAFKTGYVTFQVKSGIDVRRFRFRPYGQGGKLVDLKVQ